MQKAELIKSYAREKLVLPELLTLAITAECNLQCAHCWVDASPAASAARVPKMETLRLIEEFATLGGAAIRFTGGEPLLHPDWLELLQKAGKCDLQVLLQTNGMLFGARPLQAMQRLELADLQIQISFDGSRAATHDLVRGAGAFEQTLLGVQRLIDSGFGKNLTLFFTEMRHNLHELPDLLGMADRLGIGSVSSGSLVLCGRAGEELVEPPEPEQYLPLLQRFHEDAQFRQLYEKLGCIAAFEWCDSETSRQGCDFARTPYLSAQGQLYPCLLCHAEAYAVSAVYSKGLSAALQEGLPLWSSLQVISRQRSETIPECQACAFHQSCAGGCMGRAHGSFGDFLVAEDRCQQKKTVLQWKKNN